MDGQKNIRAFLAVEPTEDVLQAVSRLQENLKKEIKGKIRWTRPQGNHITLKFFGNIDQDDVKNICAIIKKPNSFSADSIFKCRKISFYI